MTASCNSITLSGTVKDPNTVARATQMLLKRAKGTDYVPRIAAKGAKKSEPLDVLDPEKRKENDAKRKEMIDKARDLVAELKLKNIVLTIGAMEMNGKVLTDKYALKDVALTAVLYRALRIRNSHEFKADELTKKDAPAIDVLMKDVEKHLVPE